MVWEQAAGLRADAQVAVKIASTAVEAQRAAEAAARAADAQAETALRAVERARRKGQESAGRKLAELQSSLDVERAKVVDLKEQVVMERGKAISVAAPLQWAQAELAEARTKVTELEGRRMAEGRALTRLRNLVEAQPALQEREQTTRQLESALEAARVEADQLKEAAAAAMGATDAAAAEAGPRVVPLQATANSPYNPFVAEMMRRLVSEGKVAAHNVGAVWAIVYAGITRTVPSEVYIPNAAYVDHAFHKLGVMDAEDLAAEHAADLHSWAIASDTGNRKTLSQYNGAMELMSLTRWKGKPGEKGEPVTSPLACKDLGNNQTARQGCAALLAAFERAKLQALKLTQVEGDSTEHAEQQRRKFITALEQLGLQAVGAQLPRIATAI